MIDYSTVIPAFGFNETCYESACVVLVNQDWIVSLLVLQTVTLLFIMSLLVFKRWLF